MPARRLMTRGGGAAAAGAAADRARLARPRRVPARRSGRPAAAPLGGGGLADRQPRARPAGPDRAAAGGALRPDHGPAAAMSEPDAQAGAGGAPVRRRRADRRGGVAGAARRRPHVAGLLAELQAGLCRARRPAGAAGSGLGVPHRARGGAAAAAHRVQTRKLSRAAMETLAVDRLPAAGHARRDRGRPAAWRWGRGPSTCWSRPGWVAPKGRREAPGRPVTWVTTPAFLDQFALGFARRPAAARRAGGRFAFQSAARRLEAQPGHRDQPRCALERRIAASDRGLAGRGPVASVRRPARGRRGRRSRSHRARSTAWSVRPAAARPRRCG